MGLAIRNVGRKLVLVSSIAWLAVGSQMLKRSFSAWRINVAKDGLPHEKKSLEKSFVWMPAGAYTRTR